MSDSSQPARQFHTLDVLAGMTGIPSFLTETKIAEQWLSEAIVQLALKQCGREELAWLLALPVEVLNEDLPPSCGQDFLGSSLWDLTFLPRGSGCTITGSKSAAYLNGRSCTICNNMLDSASHVLVLVQDGPCEQPGQTKELKTVMLARKNLQYAVLAENTEASGWPSIDMIPLEHDELPQDYHELLGDVTALPEHLHTAEALAWLAGAVARLIRARGCGREEIGYVLCLPEKGSSLGFGGSAVTSSIEQKHLGMMLQDLMFTPQGATCMVEGSTSLSYLNGCRGVACEACPNYKSHVKIEFVGDAGADNIHRKNLRLIAYKGLEWSPAVTGTDLRPSNTLSNPKGAGDPSKKGFFTWLFCCSEVAKVPAEAMPPACTANQRVEKQEDANGQPSANSLPAAPGALSISEELQRLAQLRNDGILTEAEFEQAKAKFLAA